MPAMQVSEKIELYKDTFQNDSLFIEINNRGLLQELFNDIRFFERVQMDANVSYSTKEAASILGIDGKGQTLINLLNRYDLQEYLGVTRIGSRGMYRYDYKSLFRFKMILLLMDFEKLNPLEIASFIGTRPEYILPNKQRIKKSVAQTEVISASKEIASSKDISNLIEKIIESKLEAVGNTVSTISIKMTQYMQMLIKAQTQLNEAKNEKNIWEQKLNNIIQDIESADQYIKLNQMYIEFHQQKAEKSQSTLQKIKQLFGIKQQLEPLKREEIQNIEAQIEKWEKKKEDLFKEKENLSVQKESILNKVVQAETQLREIENKVNMLNDAAQHDSMPQFYNLLAQIQTAKEDEETEETEESKEDLEINK